MPDNVPPETVALVRRRYADGATLAVLKAESGITSLWTLYRCLDGRYDDGSGAPLPALPRRRDITHRAARRAELVKRLWHSAERQVEQIEARMAQSGLAADDPERDARALAVLVRTLRELTAFDAEKRGKGKQQQKPENEQPIPRNIDELRRELARKIEALIEAESGSGADAHPA